MLKLTLVFFVSMSNIALYGAYLIPIDLVFNKNPIEVEDRQELLSPSYNNGAQLIVPLHQEAESTRYTDDPFLGVPVFVQMLNKGNLQHHSLHY